MDELFIADRQHHIIQPRADHRGGLIEGGGRCGAGVFDVDHRHAANAQRAQHHFARNAHLTRDRASGGIAHIGGLNVLGLQPRIGQRRKDRLASKGFEGQVGVFAEGGHPASGNDGIAFHRIRLTRGRGRSSDNRP
jgi:hypothetical protein